MKDFLSLFNDILARGAGQTPRRESYEDEGCLNMGNKLFPPNKYGTSRGKTKSIFLLIMVGVFGIAAGCLVLFVNPYSIIFKLKTILSDGGEIFEIFRAPPIELYLRVHLFNVTNREAFLAGKEKLRVQEVGPYVYREHLEHANVTFNKNGTMTSVPLHPLEWMPELSNGTEEDILILPNIALLSFANVMLGKSYFAQMSVNLLIRQTDTQPLVAMTAREFMFGYKSSLVTLGNKILPSWISFDKLGLIDRMYDFEGDVATIYTGETDIAKSGLIATYNRSPKMPQWDLPCGNIKDSSDGTKFQSFIKPNDTLTFFRKSLCRSMQMERVGNETIRNGLRGYKYKFVENALDNGEFRKENKCFCRNGKCMPRGLVDVANCYYGFPIALSYPHFYQTDENVRAMTEGTHPDPAKHESYFIVQPESGLPLEVSVRMQINMALGDLTPISRCAQFKNLVLPMLWTDISLYKLPSSLSTRFSIYINTLPLVQDVAVYLLLMGGAAFVLVAIIKLLRKPDEIRQMQDFVAEKPEPSAKSPAFNSKDVLSDIIDEGRQVIFGKKSVRPKSNVYRETVRQRSSMNLFGFMKRDSSQLRKQLTKEELYDVKKSSQDAEPLKLSSSDSDGEQKSFFAEASDKFSEDVSRRLEGMEEDYVKRLTSPIERREDQRRAESPT